MEFIGSSGEENKKQTNSKTTPLPLTKYYCDKSKKKKRNKVRVLGAYIQKGTAYLSEVLEKVTLRKWHYLENL